MTTGRSLIETKILPKAAIKKPTRKAKKAEEPKEKDLFGKIITKVTKRSGKGTVQVLSEQDHLAEVKRVVSTGFPNIDALLMKKGNPAGRGLPCGKVIEIFGPEASGKSSFCQLMAKAYQDAGGLVVYIDFENALDKGWLEDYQVNLKKVLYTSPETMEEGWDFFWDVLNTIREEYGDKGPPVLIVWDSIAQATPEEELQKGFDKAQQPGVMARAMGRGCRGLLRKVSETSCTPIFVNQEREKIGIMFGDKTTRPGGKALGYARTIGLRFTNIQRIKKGTESTGLTIQVEAKKNRLNKPFMKTVFILDFDDGPSYLQTVKYHLKELKILKTSGKNSYKISKMTVKEDWNEFSMFDFREFVELHKQEIASLLMGEAIAEEDIPEGYDDNEEEIEEVE